ncbi:hypothetical protein D3C75_1011680 [compost metagenome]
MADYCHGRDVHHGVRPGYLVQRHEGGPAGLPWPPALLRRRLVPGLYVVRLVWRSNQGKPCRTLQPATGHDFSLGNVLVHFFGSDVLHRILRRTVLCANLGGALARW